MDTIAETMNTIYGSGGFYSGFGGSIDEDGCYVSKYSEEEPMPPFAKFIYDHFVCYVYDCAVTVLFDLQTRQTITGLGSLTSMTGINSRLCGVYFPISPLTALQLSLPQRL